MSPAAVSYAAVDDLVEALKAADIHAAADPADVRTPGVYVDVTAGFSLDHIGAYTHKLRLHLVVADNGYARSRDALVALANAVFAVVTPTDDPYFQGLQLPTLKPLPGLVLPFDLTTAYDA